MKPKKVRKAIIATAGTGTRFLPQTKAMPKEILPIMGKPIIQWIVEELVDVGVKDIIIVTGAQKRALEDHFDRSVELEQTLIAKGKKAEADEIRAIAEMANFVFVRQKGGYGDAVPLINTMHLAKNEPFFYVSADDLFVGNKRSRARQLLDAYEKTGKSILSAVEKPMSEIHKYGVVHPEKDLGKGLHKLSGLVEKPPAEDAPSNYIKIFWLLLTPEVLKYVDKISPNKVGELCNTDIMNEACKGGEEIYAQVLDGTYHDCGNYIDYLKASLHYATQYEHVRTDITDFVHTTLGSKK